MIVPGVEDGFVICVLLAPPYGQPSEAVVWRGDEFAVSFPWRDDKWNNERAMEAQAIIKGWMNAERAA